MAIDALSPIAIDELHAPREFMQSPLWAETKRRLGDRPYAFSASIGGNHTTLLALDQQPDDTAGVCYVPHGPDLSTPLNDYAAAMFDLAWAMQPHLPRHIACIRFDPPWPSLYWEDDDEYRGKPAAHLQEIRMNFGRPSGPVRKAPTDVQPVDSLTLDLSPSEERLLASMKPKTRYNIRLASRHGVRVERYAPGDRGLERALGEWNRLAEETESRHALAATDPIHIRALFEAAADLCGAAAAGATVNLSVARATGTPFAGTALAAAVIARSAERAFYLYGASSGEERQLMAPYALQWDAIRAAKSAGCREYDFCGIPPAHDPGHPLHGLYRFKRGFGGREVHLCGCWDVPLDEEAYEVLRARESAGPSFHG